MNIKNKLGIVGILLVVLVGNSGCAQHYGYRDGVKVTTVYATAVQCDGEAAAIAAGAIKRIEAEPCPPSAKLTYTFQEPQPETVTVVETFVDHPNYWYKDDFGQVVYFERSMLNTIGVSFGASFSYGGRRYQPYWEHSSWHNDRRHIGNTWHSYFGRKQHSRDSVHRAPPGRGTSTHHDRSHERSVSLGRPQAQRHHQPSRQSPRQGGGYRQPQQLNSRARSHR